MFQLENSAYLQLDPSDYFQCMMFFGLYSPEILRLLKLIIHPGDSVIDVGAHIGYFSVHMAILVGPKGHVYCFEPDQRARAPLVASLAANKMGWVEVFPFAVSAEAATIAFMLSPQLGWSTAVMNSHLTGLERVEVKSRALDAMVQEGQVGPNINFIKVDVEGFEVEVLRGMRETLATSRPILLLEANELMLKAQGESVNTILVMLEAAEYEAYGIAKANRKEWRGSNRNNDTSNARSLFNLARLSSAETDFQGDLLALPREKANSILTSMGSCSQRN